MISMVRRLIGLSLETSGPRHAPNDAYQLHNGDMAHINVEDADEMRVEVRDGTAYVWQPEDEDEPTFPVRF